jgi:hypothetical protein
MRVTLYLFLSGRESHSLNYWGVADTTHIEKNCEPPP